MPVIREYYRCGYCGKKQAGVERTSYPAGGVFYRVHCRSCGCTATYGEDLESDSGRNLQSWPGGEAAAAALIDSDNAKGRRKGLAQRARDIASDGAWEGMLDAARKVIASDTKMGIMVCTVSKESIQTLEQAIRLLEQLDEFNISDGTQAGYADWREHFKALTGLETEEK